MMLTPLGVTAQTLTSTNMDPDWQGINGWAWYVGYSGGDYTNESAAQEFVTTASGKLSILEASVDRSAGGAPLVITFHEAVGNLPGAVLGSVEIPSEDVFNWASQIPTPINVFDVSAADVFVEAGQNYFVTFTTPVAGAVRYRAILTAANANSFGYRALYSKDGGATWVYPNITPEIGMRLYVDSGPSEFQVDVDVLADTKKTRIRLGQKKPKPLKVNVFGNQDVSAEDFLVESILLGDSSIVGGVGTVPTDSQILDIDGDGIADVQLTFNLKELENNGSIDANSIVLELQGLVATGDLIYGYDMIEISRSGKSR
jgi:hypothetical protein